VYRLVPYGYRRIKRSATAPAHLEIYEPEAAVISRIFNDFVAGGHSMRRICRLLFEDGILSPTGKESWSIVTVSKILGNPTYKGTARYNRHQAPPPPPVGTAHGTDSGLRMSMAISRSAVLAR
jgi:site-specific DNA recombinase